MKPVEVQDYRNLFIRRVREMQSRVKGGTDEALRLDSGHGEIGAKEELLELI